jgi:hypothetical protein
VADDLTPQELDRLAHLLYDECQTPKPSWENLSEVTQGVWKDYVLAGIRPQGQ